jgi:hypothetical protein
MGSQAKPWSGKGYQGLTCGQVEYGTRHEDDLIRIKGALAENVWEVFHGYATGIPRLDLQVTVWDGEDVLPRLQQIYDWAKGRVGGLRSRPVFDLRQTTMGGGTLYVGRRQSPVLGRVYDCGMKHPGKEFEGSIRAEAEVHGRRAWQLAAALRGPMMGQTQRAAWVLSWFEARVDSRKTDGIFPTLRRYATATDQAVILPSLPRIRVGCRRSLEIARKQWGPTARRLVQAGLGPEFLASLGLSISAQGNLVVRGPGSSGPEGR